MTEQNDIVREFLEESYENLDRLDGELVALEKDPTSNDILSSIFRTIHTIKGTCGFLEFSRLESVTHAGENLLCSLRDGTLLIDDEITTALLRLVDSVREMLACIEQTGEEKDETFAELVETLHQLNAVEPKQEASFEAAVDAVVVAAMDAVEDAVDAAASEQGDRDHPKDDTCEQGSSDASIAPDADNKEDAGPSPAVSPETKSQNGGEPAKSDISANNIRVQVDQLDKLMNLAGELVLARNQILQSAASSQDPANIATAQRLNLITSELQEGIMKVRMQPVGILWSKFPRVVRDLSKQCGNRISLQMEGKETDLDKTLLEAIKDPLTHLVRNSVDHGIETPEERIAAGKSEQGVLLLRAYHESGQVNIEIIDDGKGIDAQAIKEKAVVKGLLSSEEAAAMSDRQAVNLIFHAGLSTAAQVTNVSGRGVGMDVVKTNIEKIGGTIDVLTKAGHGTTIRIKIPLTLAIIPALIVTTSSDRYAIPQVSLVELVRLEGEEAERGIEDLHGTPVYRLRGNLLPLVYLNRQLEFADVEATTDDGGEIIRNIVVVRADDKQFGLVVDEINDTEEIVVKPLDRQTKSVTVFAGTTILGDGKVALIMDVLGLAERANVINEERHDRLMDDDVDADAGVQNNDTFLIFRAGGGRRMAIDLNDVDRLEEFPESKIERTGDLEVVQYRDEIMPLVRVSSGYGAPSAGDDVSDDESAMIQVVVHSQSGQRVGLIVDVVDDILDTCEAVRRPSTTAGIKSAIVIEDRVTDLLDLESYVCGVLNQSAADAESGTTATDDTGGNMSMTRQFCTFYLGDLFFGIDVMQLQEVLRHQEMTRVPLSSDIVQGLINLRGQTVTALDMRLRLGLPPLFDADAEPEEDELPMNMVLRTGECVVSIIVDRIGDVLTVEDTDRADVPDTVEPKIREMIKGVYKLPKSLLLVLDIEMLIAAEELAIAA